MLAVSIRLLAYKHRVYGVLPTQKQGGTAVFTDYIKLN